MIAEVYNRVSATYDRDWNGIYRKSRAILIDQVVAHCAPTLHSALDLCVGTGNAFADLEQHLHIGHRIGNDISPGMLRQARRKLGPTFQTICDDALNVDRHLPEASQDLVLCHFLFSFVDREQLLHRAWRLLKPGGWLSIATSTQGAFAEIYRDQFPWADKLLAVQANLARSFTPANPQELELSVTRVGFEIIATHRYQEETIFRSFRDIHDWAIDSGWAAQYFANAYWRKWLQTRLWFAVARLIFYPLYPVVARNDIVLMLVRRPH